jgi:ribulose-phosphate 3-epimerase
MLPPSLRPARPPIVHAEASRHLYQLLRQIRAAGVSPGVTLNPATPLAAIEDVLPLVDQVLVMSVDPGFGGQRFIPASLSRIAALRERLDAAGLNVLLSVDGGVKADNAASIVAAGATVLVAGTAIFSPDYPVADGIVALRHAAADDAPRD